jgi:hypothetical protein
MNVTDELDTVFEERMRKELSRRADGVEVDAGAAMKAVHLRTESIPRKPRRRGARVVLLATAGLCGVLGFTTARECRGSRDAAHAANVATEGL